MSKNIALDSKRVGVYNAPQAAASTTLTTGVFDMQAYDSAMFEVLIGTLTTGQTLGTIQVQAGNAANGSDMANLAGAVITIADANTATGVYIEVAKPVNFRYLRLVITRNTQACQIVAAMLWLFFGHKKPTSDDATTVGQTVVVVDPEYVTAGVTTANTTYPGSTTQIVSTTRTSS